jgi:hypothetical protein
MRFGITGQHPKNPTLLSSERPLTGAQCLLSTTFFSRAGEDPSIALSKHTIKVCARMPTAQRLRRFRCEIDPPF